MGMATKIKMLMAAENINITQLAGMMNTSQSNLSKKLKRDNFSEKEMEEIAEVCGAKLEIHFVLKDGTKI